MNQIDTSFIEKIVEESFGDVVARADISFQEVIEDSYAFADQGPYFQDRDIVLSGRLRDSQMVNVQGNKATFIWNPVGDDGHHYAADVYAGFQAGKTWVPGRDWPSRGIDKAEVAQTLASGLKRRGFDAKVVDQRKIG